MSQDQRLRVFLAVATAGAITRAAEILNISQPAVSRHIHLLEREVGQPLLRRHGRGITLTEAGETLRGSIEPAFKRIDGAVGDLRLIGGTIVGHLRIASVHTLNCYFAPALVARIARQYPRLRLQILGRSSQEVGELVERGHADVGIVYDTMIGSGGLDVRFLHDERMVLYHRRDFQVPANPAGQALVTRSLPLVVFPQGYALRQLIDRTFGSDLFKLVQVETLDLMLEVVRTGIAACVLPGALPRTMIEDGGLVRQEIAGPPLHRRVVAIVRESQALNPLASAVLATLGELAAQLADDRKDT